MLLHPIRKANSTRHGGGGSTGLALGLVVLLAVAALLGDVLYEGLRSVLGPYLSSLGLDLAETALFGVLPELVVVAGRLAAPVVAEITPIVAGISGSYILTAVIIPLIGLVSNPVLVSLLFSIERFAKGLRAPLRDTVMTYLASREKLGLAFGILEILDQVGAVLGPGYIALLLALGLSLNTAITMLAVFAVPLVLVAVVLWSRLRLVGMKVEVRKTSTRLAREEVLLLTALSIPWIALPHFTAYSAYLVHYMSTSSVALSYLVAMAVDAVLAIPTGLRASMLYLLLLPGIGVSLVLAPQLRLPEVVLIVLVGILYGIAFVIQEVVIRTLVGLHARPEVRVTMYSLAYSLQTLCQLAASLLLAVTTINIFAICAMCVFLVSLLLISQIHASSLRQSGVVSSPG